jgi:WD40 repeat protein
MTPPWPNKAFNVGSYASVFGVAFSPSGSQLAFSTNNNSTNQHVVHVWERWGKETFLVGRTGFTGCVHCLEHSLDGECLASGSADGSIRIWSRASCDTNSSQTHRERPTRTPQEADKVLLGVRSVAMALSFLRTDSNLLASGESNGEIKVWNVKEQACVDYFDSGSGPVRSLFHAGGAESACLAATRAMSVIRLWRAEGSADLANETIGEADPGRFSPRNAVFSPSGSFLATSLDSRRRNESKLALTELETMTKTQSVVMPRFIATCFAFSTDSKQLVVGDSRGRIRLFQTDDFSVQRDLEALARQPVRSVAFDATGRFLAFGCSEGRLELRSLQTLTLGNLFRTSTVALPLWHVPACYKAS